MCQIKPHNLITLFLTKNTVKYIYINLNSTVVKNSYIFSIYRITHVTGYVSGKSHLIITAVHVLSVMHAKKHKFANYVLKFV